MQAIRLAIPSFFLVLVANAARLIDFQVTQPPVVPSKAQTCTIKLIERDFAFSYGSPELVQYTPPTDCGPPGSWAAITLNLTVTSNGTQYDRLGTFTLQEVEIWRTSTPEPTRGDGIIWTYIKDVTRYTPLFAKPGTFVMQLDNIVQPGLDGVYSSVVHATFYTSSDKYPAARQPNVIIPIKSLANNSGAQVSVPPQVSVPVTFPRNVVEIYAEIYASGNGAEEFWYFNMANEYLNDLPSGTTYGNGPFREVRLLVDGQVAGVAFPYASIFTGGYIPPAWRPITAYGALDLPTYYVDLTPFAPLLADGFPHNISLDVSSAEANHTINDNWFVSANLQVVTDKSDAPTTGKITAYTVEPYAQTAITGSTANGEVNVTVSAMRKLHIEADVVSGSGKKSQVVWSQYLSFSNNQQYLANTLIQNAVQKTSGSSISTHDGVIKSSDQFSYPLNVNFTALNVGFTAWTTYIDHSYDRIFSPSPFVLGSMIKNRQQAGGILVLSSSGNTGNGTNDNDFSYSDFAGNTYWRRVAVEYNHFTHDTEGGNLAPGGNKKESPMSTDAQSLSQCVVRIPGERR